MRKLHIARDLALPAEEFLEAATAIIGKRGRGKSGLVKVFMEECCRTGLPFVALDPVGILWGIRSSADGKKIGKKVLVVGGSHGDLRLERRAGAEVAEAVIRSNVPCVIDFSEEPKAAYREFVRDFSHAIYRGNDSPRLIIVEEAPELVPQRLRPDMTQVFEAVERLVSRGRNKGLGVLLVSQRAATISKDVLTQIDSMIVFGLTSPQDRKALQEWVEARANPDMLRKFEAGLAGLKRREAWIWSPEALDLFRPFRVRKMETFHPDKTHLRRQGLLKIRPAQTNVTTIVKRLGTAMEKFAKDREKGATVTSLQAKIQRLESQLVSRPKVAPDSQRAWTKRFTDAISPLRSQMKLVLKGLSTQVQTAQTQLLLAQTLSNLLESLSTVSSRSFDKAIVDVQRKRIVSRSERPVPKTAPGVYKFNAQSQDLTRPQHRILQAIAELESFLSKPPSKIQVAFWAGYSPHSGGFNNYCGNLRTLCLLEYPGPGLVSLTSDGEAILDGEVHPPASVEEFHQTIRSKVGEPRWRILQALINSYPHSMSKEELAERAGYRANSGGFNNYCGFLRSMGLIDYPAPRQVVALPVMFLEGG